jgi:hypothetical protein
MNRRSLIGRAVPILAAIGLPVAHDSVAQESTSRDGTWWRGLSASDHITYVVGFMDGMQLGGEFSYWHMSDSEQKSCAGLTANSYSQMLDKYLGKVTAGQLTDGLTDFYEDYRNRSILIHGAVWLVVQSISGVPKDELEKLIESWRKNATASP